MKLARPVFGAAAAVFFTLSTGAAPADDSPAPPPVPATDEVVVTARKRPEDVQRIPEQVTVISSDVADHARVSTAREVMSLTPSLMYINPGNPVEVPLILRGVGNYGLGEPAVGFFVDGVYLLPASFATQDLLDVERVEVLRGPQTTLYGKSTVGGAINVVTRKPTGKLEAFGRVTVGEHDLFGAAFRLNGPIVEDRLSARVAATFRDFDGFYRNRSDRRPRDDDEDAAVRISVRALPSDTLDVIPAVAYRRRRGGAFTSHKVADDSDYEGEPYDVDPHSFADVDGIAGALPIEVDLDDGYRLVITTASNRAVERYGADVDYTSARPTATVPALFAERHVERTDVAEEVRLRSPDEGPLRWLAGAYAYFLRTDFDQRLTITTDPPGVPDQHFGSRTTAQTYAAFGQVAWKPVDALELALGARCEHDERARKGRFGSDQDVHRAYEAFSPKGSVAVFVAKDVMAYGSVALGYKAGGFNDGDFPPFGQERVLSYEIGAKTTWLDGALTLNVAGFFTELHDQQVIDFDPQTFQEFTINQGESRILGCEAEALARPLRWLTVGAAAAYLDARYTDYDADTVGPGGAPGHFDFDGNRLQDVPLWTAVLLAEARVPLTEKVDLVARMDTRFQGVLYWDKFNTTKQRPYEVVNVAAGARIGAFEVLGFADNALDARYFTNFVPGFTFPVAGGSDVAANGAPRLFGVMVTATF